MCICQLYNTSFNICVVLRLADQTHRHAASCVLCNSRTVRQLFCCQTQVRLLSGEFDIHEFSHPFSYQERVYL
jgi:hypothetical protein